MMTEMGFEGWYFKHQKDENTVVFIPGRAESGAFIQMITPQESRRFSVPAVAVYGDIILAGNCQFSPRGCKIDLPDVKGEIRYGAFTKLKTDIMGPFRFLPMECRHGIISMAHTLCGSMTVDGKEYDFNGGNGYIEKDSGVSFPRRYLWMHCNRFTVPCSVTVSVADIPFLGGIFRGFFCVMTRKGREYRFATYNGGRIRASEPSHICLSRGNLLLELDITPPEKNFSLDSPVNGRMTGTVREGSNTEIRVRLWERDKPVFDLTSGGASYECVGF